MPALKDRTGERFDHLLVIERAHRDGDRRTYWLCQCDCGDTIEVRGDMLPRYRSCGCMKSPDRTGQVFGRLTVLERAENGPHGQSRWLCRCVCGTEKVIHQMSLVRGLTRSCGCLRRELVREHRTETPGYGPAHKRIRVARGNATEYPCVDCSERADHWSYDHTDPNELIAPEGPYSAKPEHYSPRCVPCHKVFDLGRKAVAA